jgi:hypothetical protein
MIYQMTHKKNGVVHQLSKEEFEKLNNKLSYRNQFEFKIIDTKDEITALSADELIAKHNEEAPQEEPKKTTRKSKKQ